MKYPDRSIEHCTTTLRTHEAASGAEGLLAFERVILLSSTNYRLLGKDVKGRQGRGLFRVRQGDSKPYRKIFHQVPFTAGASREHGLSMVDQALVAAVHMIADTSFTSSRIVCPFYCHKILIGKGTLRAKNRGSFEG